jgi:hypothetical protein
MEYFILFFCGSFGAIIKDVLKDGYLAIPHLVQKRLYLGFFAGALVGGVVGVIVDHSYITAFLAGYTGFSVIETIMASSSSPLKVNVLNKING